jgi:hypothetical protein
MSKLIENGYVEKRDKKFFVTEKAMSFYETHKIKNEGHIATLFRIAPIFKKEKAKADCVLTMYFAGDPKGKYHML